MAKQPRPDLPGVAFHLASRLQDKAHRFTPGLRDRVVRLLMRQAARSDVRLLAFVVMTNHLHLVVIQGERPLGRFMQPFLRSVALSVHRVHGTEGHVFERRYRDRVCNDVVHLRNAIAYTHLNPVKAGLCKAPGDWPWSSHALYQSAARDLAGHAAGVGDASRPNNGRLITAGDVTVDVARGLYAFAMAEAPGHEHLAAAYDDYLRAFPSTGTEAITPELPASADPGAPPGSDPRPPLESVAAAFLCRNPGFTLDDMRARWGTKIRRRVRQELARECARAGYSGREIAVFLHVSESTVSRMLVA